MNSLCKDYNPVDGSCISCYIGYKISGTKCIPGSTADNNCKIFQDNICT